MCENNESRCLHSSCQASDKICNQKNAASSASLSYFHMQIVNISCVRWFTIMRFCLIKCANGFSNVLSSTNLPTFWGISNECVCVCDMGIYCEWFKIGRNFFAIRRHFAGLEKNGIAIPRLKINLSLRILHIAMPADKFEREIDFGIYIRLDHHLISGNTSLQ